MNNIQTEEDLICEALVREIGRASRWSARVDAWQALLSTRREGENLRREQEHLTDKTASGSPNTESPPTTGSAVNLLDETAFQRDRAEMELMAVICAVNGFCKTKPDMMITEFARIMPKVIRFARLAAEEDMDERQNETLHVQPGREAGGL